VSEEVGLILAVLCPAIWIGKVLRSVEIEALAAEIPLPIVTLCWGQKRELLRS